MALIKLGVAAKNGKPKSGLIISENARSLKKVRNNKREVLAMVKMSKIIVAVRKCDLLCLRCSLSICIFSVYYNDNVVDFAYVSFVLIFEFEV